MISFFIVARNAQNTISALLANLKEQTFPQKDIEVILVDSASTDGTKSIMQSFSGDFSRVLVLDNPKKSLPSGWNIALEQARGDIIVRVDAHATIPGDFLQNIAEDFHGGEKIVGGPRPSIAPADSPWQKTLLFAETSLFGSGIALYRRAEDRRYVNTVAHGAYAREVFETVGGYDERLLRTEDNEIHYRMKKAGFRFLYDPKIESHHHVRSSFSRMCRQKFLNGYWIGITMGFCPQCFSPYHFAPLLFVVALLGTGIAGFLGQPLPLLALLGLYGLADLGMTVLSLPGKRFSPLYLLLPLLFLGLHLSYGVGTLLGLLYMPVYRLKRRSCPNIEKVKTAMRTNRKEPL